MAVEATSEAEKEPLKPTIKRREHTLVTFADDNLNVSLLFLGCTFYTRGRSSEFFESKLEFLLQVFGQKGDSEMSVRDVSKLILFFKLMIGIWQAIRIVR